ncbi:hypothetical protein TIFTF001_021161 [Ficus carica]|uniref:Uncharacterized protein n=1 Tax=Ficus carica TaxID=3494 RepID=A0AA88DAG7_FICCA|nr:hypothetical protein TIFTF001_021161 [Ficus carica]
MGTKIEYAINPLGASQSSKRFTVHGVDDWDHLPNSGVKGKYSLTIGLENKIHQNSMDRNRMLDKYNVDSIKKTMQMHEDIFKHQVSELHRLYSVQKMLMDELKKEIKQSKIWDPMSSSDISTLQLINRHQPATKLTSPGATNFQIQGLRDDNLNSRECSGSCSGDTMRISRGFDLERPAEEDMSTGVSAADEYQGGRGSKTALKSSKMSIDGPDEESDVELTLSIGSSASKKGSKANNKEMKELDSSASFKSDRGGECSEPTTSMSSSSAIIFDQERKQPHWLFHSLKLK